MAAVLITPEALRLTKTADAAVERLREAGFEIRYPRDPQLARGTAGPAEMIAELRDVEAVIASAEHYSAEVLEALPQLRVIARCGVGYDRVDVAAATRLGKAVTITPTANHEAVAELALALMFAVAKHIVPNDRAVRSGRWPREPLAPIRGRTLGVCGLGRIGRSLAVRALAMGMPVIATEQLPDHDFVLRHGVQLVDFDELLARSDFLSIHCPLNESTRGMFDADVFRRMKRGAVFINTARGRLVVEQDLIAALHSRHLAGAGLDVFEQEPPSADNPLFRMDQVVVCPHIAGADDRSMEAMGVEAAECIIELSLGHWPDGAVVNAELRDTWRWERQP